jgi:hypothetical protein
MAMPGRYALPRSFSEHWASGWLRRSGAKQRGRRFVSVPDAGLTPPHQRLSIRFVRQAPASWSAELERSASVTRARCHTKRDGSGAGLLAFCPVIRRRKDGPVRS